MTLEEIIIILQNRIITLSEARKRAVANGDLDGVVKIDADLLTTENAILSIQTVINL